MTYLAISLFVVWFGVMLCLAGLYLNDIRLVLNNVAPEACAGAATSPPLQPVYMATIFLVPIVDTLSNVWFLFDRLSHMSKGLIRAIDPDSLNETGRTHLQRMIRHEWMMLGWMVGGFVLTVWWMH